MNAETEEERSGNINSNPFRDQEVTKKYFKSLALLTTFCWIRLCCDILDVIDIITEKKTLFSLLFYDISWFSYKDSMWFVHSIIQLVYTNGPKENIDNANQSSCVKISLNTIILITDFLGITNVLGYLNRTSMNLCI